MRPVLLLGLSSLTFAIDANHQPDWVKSVVASASREYAPWLTDTPAPIVERQVPLEHIGGPRKGPPGTAPYPVAPLGVPHGPPGLPNTPPNGPPQGRPFPPQGRPTDTAGPGSRPPQIPDVTSNGTEGSCSFWLEDIEHQGVAPYTAAGYEVFRNVKDFGAVGDGVVDDTAAINVSRNRKLGQSANSSHLQALSRVEASIQLPFHAYSTFVYPTLGPIVC